MLAIDTPRTQEQLKEALLDPEQRKSLLESPENLEKFVADYSVEQLKNGGLAKMIKDGQQEGLLEALREFNGNGKGLPMGDEDDEDEAAEWENGFVQGKRVTGGWSTEVLSVVQQDYMKRARTISKTHGFKRPSEYYQAIFHQLLARGEVDPRLKDLSINIGADGGYLVPEALSSQLFEIPLEAAVVRPRAMVIPMDSLTLPFPVIDDTSHASNVFGGVVANWTDENATITETQPTFARVKLEVHKLALYTEVPNELFGDSIVSLEALLNRMLPEAAAYFEDDAFLVGTGAGRPLGVLNASNKALIAITRDTASEVNWLDIVNMYARMLPTSLGTAVWVINQTVFPQLATMALDIGTGGSAVWLSNGVGGPPATILGRPVLITEKVPGLGSQGDISFIDFSQYLLGDRMSVNMATSAHFKFQQDQTVFRVTERVDGQPWMRSALTPRNGGDTLSAYVTLAA